METADMMIRPGDRLGDDDVARVAETDPAEVLVVRFTEAECLAPAGSVTRWRALAAAAGWAYLSTHRLETQLSPGGLIGGE